ncbi:MAG: hypothetical protein IKT08_07820 [Bacteroidales bacterium]|nr:hypothetical protein [Bacteroidales bacterium]
MEGLMERFNGLNALVVGDVMIDTYSKGVVERMSPEAPVSIVNLRDRFSRLGGAANVALNLKALGADATVCAVVGDDLPADTFFALMQAHGMKTDGLVRSDKRRTTVKQRVFNGDQQVLRIDEEDTFDLTDEEHRNLWHVIEKAMTKTPFDVIVLQDYNKGVLTEKMIHDIIQLANSKHIPVAVDPKKKNFFAYEGVTLFKPNAKELRDGLGARAETVAELHQAARQLQERLRCPYLMVTLSERGVIILHDPCLNGKEYVFHHLPAHQRAIADVSGAGDTVLSVAALCAALQIDAKTTATLSNLAGGLVCEEVGVVPIDKSRFLEEVKRICHE